ncbi:cytoplasmic dynein 1 light intermediate chain 2-like [Xenia sp. Carnegie-2017]|uniref:cytoplasmic dynein 1 light intermediate chain 2-like n=1 Tax=Xenia sp. Carnegie-2017 TaxID=2897299 RepID=UPI001F0456A6|nr:cytoplasmic dynein 1 light intermediate chain 2-like [Xenia sp. Carnegie-2017]
MADSERIVNDLKNSKQDEEEEDLWSAILNDVSSSTSKKLPSNKSILLLGNDGTGKTSLIVKLQTGAAEIKKGHAMEYSYIDIYDEDRDDSTWLNVWVMDGDARYKNILKFAVTKKSAKDVTVILIGDMSRPWTIMDNLNSWVHVLREHIHSLNLSPKELNEMESRITKQFQEYIDPEQNDEKKKLGSEEEDVVLPLDPEILTDNLGFPIVVVCTKTDSMLSLEKERDFKNEHFDFIQQQIRRFCLKYGAGLVYTSVKESKNCNLLKQYLLHKIYSFPFRVPASVLDRESIFIPSGWDNMSKISILNEQMTRINPEDAFEDHIKKPEYRRPIQDKELECEDEQSFLEKQQQALLKNPPPPGLSRPPGMTDITKSRISASPAASRISPGGRAAAGVGSAIKTKDGVKTAAQAPGEGVLANFFNSLLSKKSNAPAVTRQGASAELEKMTRTKKMAESNTPGADSS